MTPVLFIKHSRALYYYQKQQMNGKGTWYVPIICKWLRYVLGYSFLSPLSISLYVCLLNMYAY